MSRIILTAFLSMFSLAVVDAGVMLGGLTATATNDNANGSAFGGGGLAALTNDAFLYDPDSPTSPLPNQFSVSQIFHGQHTNGEAITIDFAVAPTAIGVGDSLFVDLYGRDRFTNRDDDISVEFFDGATSLGVVSDAGITPGTYQRAELLATSTGNITGFRITGADTDNIGAANIFSLAEVRAGIDAADVAAVPEPASTSIAVLGLAGLASFFRRKKTHPSV